MLVELSWGIVEANGQWSLSLPSAMQRSFLHLILILL